MAAEIKKEIELEIAHVLFIDIVGYSKLSVNEQHVAVEELNQIVRASEQFQKAGICSYSPPSSIPSKIGCGYSSESPTRSVPRSKPGFAKSSPTKLEAALDLTRSERPEPGIQKQIRSAQLSLNQ
jgi:hypothetical protein